jgi:hypothetical protein
MRRAETWGGLGGVLANAKTVVTLQLRWELSRHPSSTGIIQTAAALAFEMRNLPFVE